MTINVGLTELTCTVIVPADLNLTRMKRGLAGCQFRRVKDERLPNRDTKLYGFVEYGALRYVRPFCVKHGLGIEYASQR